MRHSPRLLTGRDDLTNEQYAAVASEWLAEEPISRAVMEAVWEGVHGTLYEPTPATYRAAVRLVLAHAGDRGDVPPPRWWRSGYGAEPPITSVGARLVDALAFHVARVRSDGEPVWQVFDAPGFHHDGDLQLVAGRDPMPVNMTRMTLGVLDTQGVFDRHIGPHRLDAPLNTRPDLAAQCPDAALTDGEQFFTRSTWLRRTPRWRFDLPAPLEPVPTVEVWKRPPPRLTPAQAIPGVEDSDLDGYTYQVWVDEGAQYVWGDEAYDAFEPALAQVEGIEKVFGEDREVVHVLAPTLTGKQVLTAARSVVKRITR